MQDENKTPRQIERRTILKGAAWSAPVIAAAVAAPMAAASDATADVYWTKTNTQLLTLSLLNGGTLAGVKIFPKAPTAFAIENTPGIIANVTVEVSVAQAGGLDLGVGLGTRWVAGFAPATISGGTKLGSTTITDRALGGLGIGLVRTVAQDTFSVFSLGDVASGQTVNFDPVAWATVPRKTQGLTLAEINALTSYTVTAVFKTNGTTFATITESISVLAGAGIL